MAVKVRIDAPGMHRDDLENHKLRTTCVLGHRVISTAEELGQYGQVACTYKTDSYRANAYVGFTVCGQPVKCIEYRVNATNGKSKIWVTVPED